MARALVVFQREGSHPLAWLLHREYRHCFACIDDGLYWTLVDARDGLPLVKTLCASDHDLIGFYRSKGYVVMETEQGPGIRGPFCIANCVGLVKATLGIRAPFCWTPRQLYMHMRNR